VIGCRKHSIVRRKLILDIQPAFGSIEILRMQKPASLEMTDAERGHQGWLRDFKPVESAQRGEGIELAIKLDYWTVRFTVPVWVTEPEDPVTVIMYAPEVVPEIPLPPPLVVPPDLPPPPPQAPRVLRTSKTLAEKINVFQFRRLSGTHTKIARARVKPLPESQGEGPL
jgi:hypothetical protein